MMEGDGRLVRPKLEGRGEVGSLPRTIYSFERTDGGKSTPNCGLGAQTV